MSICAINLLTAITLGRAYDTMHLFYYVYVRPKADKASLICRMEPNKK